MNKRDNKQNPLQEIKNELQKCVRCGACTGVCPIYAQEKKEKFVARGKIALSSAVLKEELAYSLEFANVLDNCLLCLSCREVCSSGVRMDKIVTTARTALVEHKGLPLWKRLGHKVVNSGQNMVNALFKSGSLAQYLLFKRIPQSSGLRRRFPLPLVSREQSLPRLTFRPFRQRIPRFCGSAEAREEAVFFTGCSLNYFFPQLGEKVLQVLQQLEVRVEVPKEQVCCGAPVEASGDRKTFLDLAAKNLQALDQTHQDSPLVLACASGGYMFKHVYPEELQDHPELASPAGDISSRCLDLSEYLFKRIGPERIREHLQEVFPELVTWHDPCHLVRGQGIREEPRQLLRLCCGENFREMNQADSCCGSGGTYCLTHPELSAKILQQKIQNLIKSQATVIATACPACMIQLQSGILQNNLQVKVVHFIEILAQSMGLGRIRTDREKT